MLFQIRLYIEDVGIDRPFMLLGGPGSGKSSLMAKVTDVASQRAMQNRIPG